METNGKQEKKRREYHKYSNHQHRAESVGRIYTFNPTEKSEFSLISLLKQTTGRSVDRITVRSCNV